MNSTLVHNSYPTSFSLTNDIKYSSQDRSYSNSSLSTGEYLERRNGLASGTINQSMTLGPSGNGLDYSSSHLLHEQPFNTSSSQYLLTPPQSGDESSTVTNPSSSTFTYSTLPKNTSRNASSLDWNSSASFLHPNFHGAMPDLRQARAPQMPIISPPATFHPHFPLPRGTPMDPPFYRPASFFGDSLNGTLNRTMPIPPVFQSSSFPPMPQNQPSRPEGPPFEETNIAHQLVNSRAQSLKPDIVASIPKGFFQVDEKWTCYRRNYFSVSCAFTFKTPSLDTQCYLQRNNNSHAEPVTQWAVSIAAKTAAANNNESEPRGLVQHTPKRDKATESEPTRHLVVPGPGQALAHGGGLSHNGIFSSGPHLGPCLPGTIDSFGHPNSQSPPTQYTFERIQFQKATANNGKRRAQQQYFHVVVKLEANVGRHGGQDDWVVVATKQSHPMVVRGRSPGHYKDNRRDSQTSMDPDGSSGHNVEGGHSNFPMSSLGSNHTTSMSWAPSHQRHGHQYGTSFSHRIDESDASSVSPGSSSTLASSPAKGENYHLPTVMGRTMVPEAHYDRIVLSPIASKANGDHMDYQHLKKRTYEDDGSDCPGSFYQSSLDHAYHNPSFDFSATSTSQALCASS